MSRDNIKPTNNRTYLCIELLKTFSEKELHTFASYLSFQHFNSNKDLITLFKNLKRYALKTDTFTTELQIKVFNALGGKTTTKQKTLSKKQSDVFNKKLNKLLRLAEKFLMFQTINNNDHFKMDLLLPELLKRQQTKLYQRHISKEKKELDKVEQRGVAYHSRQYKLQKAVYNKLRNENSLTKEENYDELQYHLDVNYLLEKLHYHLIQITHKTAYSNKEFKFSSLRALKFLLDMPQYANYPLIQIKLNNINLVEKPITENFNALFNLVELNKSIIPSELLKRFYTNLGNFCANEIRKGKENYYKSLFAIYQSMHNSNILTKEGSIDIMLLKNFITVCCNTKNFESAYNIIREYKKFIPIEIKESVCYYNLGVIEFYQKNYNEAHNNFVKVKKINTLYETNLRCLILKCIYETENDYNDAVEQSFDTARLYFGRNNNLVESHRKAYLNFISILLDLYTCKFKNDKKNLLKIRKKLEFKEVVQNKKWLLNKILELEMSVKPQIA